MNDYPPEVEELPECCDEVMDYSEHAGVLTCLRCKKQIQPAPDIEPVEFNTWEAK